jgi:hypothetical protein
MKLAIATIGFMLAQMVFAQSGDYITLNITDVKVTENNNVTAGMDGTVDLKNKQKLQKISLYKSAGLSITADIKVSSNNSRRSSTKSGSVTLDVVYHSEYADGKKDKRSAQYVFYLDNDRSFVAKEQFVFKNGLKPRQVKLTFKGQLQ